MRLPAARGPVSGELAQVLEGRGDRLPALARLAHEDLQLALHVLYELHYRGFDGVDPDWEWSPDLLAVRGLLEQLLEDGLRGNVPVTPAAVATAAGVTAALVAITVDDDGPALSDFLARRADAAQFREFVVHRSIYELKEANPHT